MWIRRRFLDIVVCLLIVLAYPAAANPPAEAAIAYVTSTYGQGNSLGFYNPQSGANETIHTSFERINFTMSSTGLLAFSTRESENEDVILVDTKRPAGGHANITEGRSSDERPVEWSQDGHLLAIESVADTEARLLVWDGVELHDITPVDGNRVFTSFWTAWNPNNHHLLIRAFLNDHLSLAYIWNGEIIQRISGVVGQGTLGCCFVSWEPTGSRFVFGLWHNNYGQRALYLWDGVSTINIMPPELREDGTSGDAIWSNDGRIAFDASRNDAGDETFHSEVYVWDGERTYNLSQNTLTSDYAPAWSSDGQLAFARMRWNGIYPYVQLYSWDGTTFRGGLPDRRTFQRIAPELAFDIYARPISLANGQFAFTAYEPMNNASQIYTWDGEVVTNMSQNPNIQSFRARWSEAGDWAFMTVDAGRNQLNIRDTNNRERLVTPAAIFTWLDHDNLMLCRNNSASSGLQRKSLEYWDGQSIVALANGGAITARSSSGTLTCFDG